MEFLKRVIRYSLLMIFVFTIAVIALYTPNETVRTAIKYGLPAAMAAVFVLKHLGRVGSWIWRKMASLMGALAPFVKVIVVLAFAAIGFIVWRQILPLKNDVIFLCVGGIGFAIAFGSFGNAVVNQPGKTIRGCAVSIAWIAFAGFLVVGLIVFMSWAAQNEYLPAGMNSQVHYWINQGWTLVQQAIARY